jgi:hypothetical protein
MTDASDAFRNDSEIIGRLAPPSPGAKLATALYTHKPVPMSVCLATIFSLGLVEQALGQYLVHLAGKRCLSFFTSPDSIPRTSLSSSSELACHLSQRNSGEKSGSGEPTF